MLSPSATSIWCVCLCRVCVPFRNCLFMFFDICSCCWISSSHSSRHHQFAIHDFNATNSTERKNYRRKKMNAEKEEICIHSVDCSVYVYDAISRQTKEICKNARFPVHLHWSCVFLCWAHFAFRLLTPDSLWACVYFLILAFFFPVRNSNGSNNNNRKRENRK